MHLDACHVCVRWAAGVLPGVCYLSVLYEQVACRHVSLLRNDAYPAPAGVVADYLVTNSKVQCAEGMADNVKFESLIRVKVLMAASNGLRYRVFWYILPYLLHGVKSFWKGQPVLS